MIIKRKKTKEIYLGNLKIGGNNQIAVQSMIKSKLENLDAVKREIDILQKCGCEVIRIAVFDQSAVQKLKILFEQKIFLVPVVADIQFDYKLALDSLDAGVQCVRINPGNIGSLNIIEKVVKKAKQKNAAIRIGVNSGSIKKEILKKNNGNMVNSIVESVMEIVELFEKLKYFNFKISAKASSVLDTIYANEIISSKVDYPIHLGLTEAGPLFNGLIKSSVGLGILLSKGIGDTIRVSLTDESNKEVRAAFLILSSLGLRKTGIDIISCPTCSRTKVNLQEIVNSVENILKEKMKESINKLNETKIAVMGCIVNGPGEAKDADIGIAYGIKKAAIFKNGKVIKRVDTENVLAEFEYEINNFL